MDHMGIVCRRDKPFQTKVGLLQRVDARKTINKYPLHPRQKNAQKEPGGSKCLAKGQASPKKGKIKPMTS